MPSRFLSLIFLLVLPGFAAAAEPAVDVAPAIASPWPEIKSDLPPDPAADWGVLPNGLRYVVRPNAEPRDRITLRLVVLVGSSHENDDECGMAHFIEHMVFRGTKTYPRDSLLSALQRLGVGFGPDATAFTNQDYTIYHLELPDAREATLRQGLYVFREYADSATFDPDLIERERGVILSEKATRDTPDYRQNQANLAFLLPGSRQVRRPTIGLEENIRHFTREQFTAFYDAWYRPERMGIVVVGNVTKEAGARLIEEVFGSLKARAPARPDPTDRIAAKAAGPDIRIFREPTVGGVALFFEHPRHVPTHDDTHEERVRELRRALSFTMLQYRLSRVTRELGPGFVSPTVSLQPLGPEWQVATFAATGSIDHWRQLATTIEQEHRRAFLHGFTRAELDRAKEAFAESYRTALGTAPTRYSESWASELVNAMVYGHPPASLEAAQADMAEPLAQTTPAECLAVFRETWSRAPLHVFVAANSTFEISAELIAIVLNRSRQTDVLPPKDAPRPEFAYTQFGEPGKLKRDEKVPDLDVHLAEFENGVRFNFKTTPFEADVVQIHVRVGAGKLAQPLTQPGLDFLADYAFAGGGLGHHSATEIGDIFAGRSVGIWFRVESDACAFTARCTKRDLLPTLQLLAAYFTDPGYRPEALRDAHASFGSMYSSLASAPGGPIRCAAERILFNNDPRFGIPKTSDLYGRSLDELKDWLGPQLAHGPVEMSVVGDVSWDDAATAVGRTLGALPARAPRSAISTTQRPKMATAPRSPIVAENSPRLKQAALAWYWPVPLDFDIHYERRCRLLAAALTNRVLQRLREELGTAYSPTAEFVQYEGFPKAAYFLVYAEVDTAHAKEAADVLRREIEALRKSGFTDDEFLRAKQPFVRAREDDLRQNAYWGFTVLADAQQHPERLVAARDRAADTASITRPEIEKIFQRHFTRDNVFFFVAAPAPSRNGK